MTADRTMQAAPAPAQPPEGIPKAARSAPWGTLLLGLGLGIVAAAIVGAIAIGPLALTHRAMLPLERAYGNAVVSLVARFNAGDQTNPLAQDRRAIAAGREAYTGSCSQCHGADGKGGGVFGKASFPPATDLTARDTQEKSDAQLFWIIKNGLSFTGMPAFGDQYSDQEIWSLVSFLRSLPAGGRAIAVPTPSPAQLARADISGDAAQRGAAIYFAQGCHSCHGPVGDAPGDLGLSGSREAAEAIRQGRRGMPTYDQTLISDSQLADLIAYLDTFPPRQRQEREFPPNFPGADRRGAPGGAGTRNAEAQRS